jgi:hypothetical protein
MKKRMILLLLLAVLLCGCDAEVNIKISGTRLHENISVNYYKDGVLSDDQIKKLYRDNMPIYASEIMVDTEPDVAKGNVKYYQKSVKDITNGFNFNYSYSWNYTDYRNSKSLANGFRSYTVTKDTHEGTMMISTDGTGVIYFNDYPGLTNLTVNIKSDFEVIQSNADSVENNVYTWKFTKNNNKKGIYMLINYKHEAQTPTDKDGNPIPDPDGKDKKGNKDNKDKDGSGNDKESGDNGDSKDKEDEKEDQGKEVEEFANKHPILMIILALFAFAIVAMIVGKIARKYQKK